MRFFTARRLVLVAFVPAWLLLSVVPGCSNESEGERCGDDLGINNDDCSSGLICVAAAMLDGQANRCCNSSPYIVNDSRCLRNVSGTVGGSGGNAGASSGGNGGTGEAPDASPDGALPSAGAADVGAGGN